MELSFSLRLYPILMGFPLNKLLILHTYLQISEVSLSFLSAFFTIFFEVFLLLKKLWKNICKILKNYRKIFEKLWGEFWDMWKKFWRNVGVILITCRSNFREICGSIKKCFRNFVGVIKNLSGTSLNDTDEIATVILVVNTNKIVLKQIFRLYFSLNLIFSDISERNNDYSDTAASEGVRGGVGGGHGWFLFLR